MGRTRRTTVYPGEDAHTAMRINNREFLLSSGLVGLLVEGCKRLCARYGVDLYAYVMLSNHDHKLHASPTQNPDTELGRRLERRGKLISLGDFKRHLFSQFAREANKRIEVNSSGQVLRSGVSKIAGGMRQRRGTLIEPGDSSLAVRDARHALATLLYIFLNPVRAGMVKHPKDYPHSNFAMYWTGVREPGCAFHPEYLALGNTIEVRSRQFRQLIEAEIARLRSWYQARQPPAAPRRHQIVAHLPSIVASCRKLLSQTGPDPPH